MPLGFKFLVFGFTIVCINIWVFPGFSLRFLFWRGSCRIATTHNRFMFIIARKNLEQNEICGNLRNFLEFLGLVDRVLGFPKSAVNANAVKDPLISIGLGDRSYV
jgi:hypothetical protein